MLAEGPLARKKPNPKLVGASQAVDARAHDARADDRPPTLSLAAQAEVSPPPSPGPGARWAPPAPFEVGRFRVDEALAATTFGMTYAGVDTQAGRPVHVTVFHPAFCADTSRKRAHRERLERTLRYEHEHLAPTWAVGEAFGTMWAATAPALGEPLTLWRRDAATLRVQEAYRLVGQLLEVVEAIHRAGGVHGALSPDTVRIAHGDVLVTSPWWLEQVEVPLDQLPPPRTAWIAPELQFGEPAESRETDVYGIGMVLGFLLACGLTEPGHSLLVQGIDVPPAVDDVYVRATARNKAQRYADVPSLRAALEQAGGLEWLDAQRAAPTGSAPWQPDVETTAEDEAVPAFEVDGQFYPIEGGQPRARVVRPAGDQPPQAEAGPGGRRGRRTPARTQVQGSPRSGLAPVVEIDFRRSNTLSTSGLSGPDGLPVEPVPDEILRALLEVPSAAPPPLPPGARPSERQPVARPWASTIEALDVGGPALRLGAQGPKTEVGPALAEAPLPAVPPAALTPPPLAANDAIAADARAIAVTADVTEAAPTPVEMTAALEGGASAGLEPVPPVPGDGSGASAVYEPTVVEGIAPALLELDIFTPPSLPPIDPFAPPPPSADPWADSPLAATGDAGATSDHGGLSPLLDAVAAPRTRPEQRPAVLIEQAPAAPPPVPTEAGPPSRRSTRAAARIPTLSFDVRAAGAATDLPLPPAAPQSAGAAASIAAVASDPGAMPSLAALLGASEPPVAPPPLPGAAAAVTADRTEASATALEDERVAALLAQFELGPAEPAPPADAPLFGEPRTVRDPSGPIAGAGLSAEALAAIPIRPSSLLVPAAAVRPPPTRKPRTLWLALAALGVGAVATLVVVLAVGSSGAGGTAPGGERAAIGGAGSSSGGGMSPIGGAGGGGQAPIAVAVAGASDANDEGDASAVVTTGDLADIGARAEALGVVADTTPSEVAESAVSASAIPGQLVPGVAADAHAPSADVAVPAVDTGTPTAEIGVAAADAEAGDGGGDGGAADAAAPVEVAAAPVEGIAPPVFVPKDPDALRCPDGMAKLKRKIRVTLADGAKAEDWEVACIDRFEYPGGGAVPRTGIDLAGARAACAAKGKRLCTRSEWRRACGGTYPYGKEYDPERCNTADTDGAPRALVAAGSKGKCMSPSGAFDMVGNVAEWTSDGMVNGGTSLKNGEDATCGSASRRAGGAPHVGFRCCADAR